MALENAPENPGVNEDSEALENAPENPGVEEECEALENAPEHPGVDGQQSNPGPNDDNHDDLAEQMNNQYGARTRDGLQKSRERNSGHLFATVENEYIQEKKDPVIPVTGAHLATPQMSTKRGLKMFGNAGVAAVKK